MKTFKIISCLVAFLFSGLFIFAALDVQFVGDIKQAPNLVAVGNEVTFSVSFKPVGGVVTNFKIYGGVGELTVLQRTYASIAADKVKTDSFKITVENCDYIRPPVWFRLDPDKTSGDSNYENNYIQKAISSSCPKKAVRISDAYTPIRVLLDFSLTKIYLLSEQNTYEVHARRNISFKCDWKRNGHEPKEDFTIELYVDGVKMPSSHNTGIWHLETPWGTETAKIWIDLAGNHEFKCVVNYPGEDEKNKENNTMIQTIFIPD